MNNLKNTMLKSFARFVVALMFVSPLPVLELVLASEGVPEYIGPPEIIIPESISVGNDIEVSVRNNGSQSVYIIPHSHCEPPFFIYDQKGEIPIKISEPVACILSMPAPIEISVGETKLLDTWDLKEYVCNSDDQSICQSLNVKSGLYEVRLAYTNKIGTQGSKTTSSWFFVGESPGHLAKIQDISVPADISSSENLKVIINLELPLGTTYSNSRIDINTLNIECITMPCLNPTTVTIVPLAISGGIGGQTTIGVDVGKLPPGKITVRVIPRSGNAVSKTINSNDFKRYPDIPDNHWAKSYIDLLTDQRIISGHSDGYFRPQWNITRAEVSKMALLSSGVGILNNLPNPYIDLADDHSLRDALLTAIAKDYLPDSESLAKPNVPATRFEALKALMDAFGRTPKYTFFGLEPAFPDASNGEVAAYTTLAKEQGLISGNQGYFLPDDPVTRAEFAKIVAGLLTTPTK